MTASDAPVRGGFHSETPTAQSAPGKGQGAQRARAREDTPIPSQFGAQSVSQSDLTIGDRIEQVWKVTLGWVTPPDIWAADRPSLAKVWAHATYGQWARPGGVCRRAGQVYTVMVALPVAAVCKYLEWVTERGSRLAAAVVLVVFLAQFPPLSWLI